MIFPKTSPLRSAFESGEKAKAYVELKQERSQSFVSDREAVSWTPDFIIISVPTVSDWQSLRVLLLLKSFTSRVLEARV